MFNQEFVSCEERETINLDSIPVFDEWTPFVNFRGDNCNLEPICLQPARHLLNKVPPIRRSEIRVGVGKEQNVHSFAHRAWSIGHRVTKCPGNSLFVSKGGQGMSGEHLNARMRSDSFSATKSEYWHFQKWTCVPYLNIV